MNLETLSTRALVKMLDGAACGAREERAIREELRRRELESPTSVAGTEEFPFKEDPPYKR